MELVQGKVKLLALY